MQNHEYWNNRQKQIEALQYQKARKAYSEIEKIINNTVKELDRMILSWYEKIMGNENISFAEAKKRLAGKELEEFKWSLKEYTKRAQQTTITEKCAKQLENASARIHISRLEALKTEIAATVELMYGEELAIIDHVAREIYEDVYYQSAFAIQQDLELGWGIAAVDTKQLDDLINIPWAVDKYNFTERIWRDKDKLIANLYQILSRHLILGSDPKKPINELAKVMNTTKHNAGRLVMTESAYFGSRAREDCFKELEVERYQIIATLDLKTSAICQEMDGQIFKTADYEIGTTAPPFHVYCRTTTAPYYDDLAKLGKRAARNTETGKIYYVPRDMTYKEWREAVEDGKPTGAISGALTDKNDPDGSKRRKAADDIYEEIRNRKKKYEIEAVAKNTGFSVEEIGKIYDHVFIRKHNLGENGVRRFHPDYYMANSWLRLREGKNIKHHDMIMLKHELEEEKIMGESLEIPYLDVHKEVQKKYNYSKALLEYLKNHDV